MEKIATSNLEMIVTERCNLNCAHCLRGKCSKKDMKQEVIVSTLEQFRYIANLAICGGEPTLAIEQIGEIVSYIIHHKILVESFSVVINGTIYRKELLQLFSEMKKYILSLGYGKKFPPVDILISRDRYHLEEIEGRHLLNIYLENVQKYTQSPDFAGFKGLHGKIFREGNAEKLDNSITTPFVPMEMIMTYAKTLSDRLQGKKGICYVGPSVAVNPDGVITDCNASIEHQETLYHYGNVLEDSIEEVFQKRKAKVLSPRQFYRQENREFSKYESL